MKKSIQNMQKHKKNSILNTAVSNQLKGGSGRVKIRRSTARH